MKTESEKSIVYYVAISGSDGRQHLYTISNQYEMDYLLMLLSTYAMNTTKDQMASTDSPAGDLKPDTN
mgnify:CR=1 FL=1